MSFMWDFSTKYIDSEFGIKFVFSSSFGIE